MFSEPDSDDLTEIERRSTALLDELELIGVHVIKLSLAEEPAPHVLFRAAVGRVAFSPRVQDPDSTAINESVAQFGAQIIDAEYDQIRKEMLDGHRG